MKNGLDFYALPDDRRVKITIRKDGQPELQRHNMLVLPQAAKDNVSQRSQTYWYPHPLSNAAAEVEWIINNCTDPDTYEEAMHWLENTFDADVPVFNHPRAIGTSARDSQASRFGVVKGLDVPKVKRFTFETEEDLRRTFEENGFTFPVLVRPVEFQSGIGMKRVESHEEWAQLLYGKWYRKDHMMIQFVDSRTAEGFYYKVRMVFVGGRAFLRHIKASSNWLVQDEQNDVFRDQPERELEMADALEGQQQFVEICESLGQLSDLDFFGADIGVDLASNKYVLFEANPSMSMFFPMRDGLSPVQLLRRERFQTPAEDYLVKYVSDPSIWLSTQSRASKE